MAETVEVICNAMEFVNDELKTITEWPKEQRQAEDKYGVQYVKQLQDIPELNSRDRVRLMQIIMHSVLDMKAFLRIPIELKLEYCTVLLEDNA
ncbi:retrotransposon protein [Cucumis melo var. makuwa]|uniref:Retrotransposon protein n=2 Tax=Cucumis melo TaxID=3656 RepID=A0A5A7UV97_CUCMM|nr:retrotransposon protein [Cucumis melo var. makuwa]